MSADAGTVVADRLYSLSFRPQETALYGQRLRFELRLAAISDAPQTPTRQHWKLMVLEAIADVPADAERPAGELQVLKIGWELTLETAEALAPAQLAEGPGERRRALERIADTVNELARRAGLEAPFGPDLVDHLSTAPAKAEA